MLKQYEVGFAQAEIEMIRYALHEYAATYTGTQAMIDDLQLRLNAALACEEDMCMNKRFGMTSFCADHPQEEVEIQHVEAA